MSASLWLALHLPRLSTDRLIRAGRASAERPLAVYAKQANAFVLTAVNTQASALGLRADMPLSDARAIYPALDVFTAEPEADARTLDDIAAWCERFTPVVALDPPDGLFLDIEGCGHLFGGDGELRDTLLARLRAQGFEASAAIAPTPGAAWGLVRFSATSPPPGGGRGRGGGENSIERGGVNDCLHEIVVQQSSRPQNSPHPLAPSPSRGGGIERLPIEALRLDEEAASLLRRLGLKTVGQLMAAPRSSFTARAGVRATLRLDQALGRAAEALTPRRPPPPVFALRRFLEPLFTLDAILEATHVLCEDAIIKLDRRGAGARRLELHLFGVDGRDRVVAVGASRPERDAVVMMRLFREKLSLAAENLNAEFGIEAARLDVAAIERIDAVSRTLVAVEEAHSSVEKVDAIVDVLSARLGAKRVLRPKINDTHAPERAGGWRAALGPPSPFRGAPRGHAVHDGAPVSEGAKRPLTLFARPQPIDAIATVPDGPPIRFRWRRVLREVARAEGPERIAGDWLKHVPTRDYYRVEDKQGRRYWLYREGFYGAEAPRWYLHGLFA